MTNPNETRPAPESGLDHASERLNIAMALRGATISSPLIEALMDDAAHALLGANVDVHNLTAALADRDAQIAALRKDAERYRMAVTHEIINPSQRRFLDARIAEAIERAALSRAPSVAGAEVGK